MRDEPLRVTTAARLLGISTKDVLILISRREISYVMRDGIAHVPPDALERYRAERS